MDQVVLGTFNFLDAFLNFRYDDRLMLKVGRYKVPYTYDFYAISNTDLLTPERSLYAENFGLNRQIGLMAWGQVLDDRLDYAVGLFDGQRNSFGDFNDAKDVISYLNARPFAGEGWPKALAHLNLGGSVDFGDQNNPLRPRALRTSLNGSDSVGASEAAPAFLTFNDDVVERGDRALWELHLAYFYRRLSVLGAWDGGFNDFARGDSPFKTRLPVGGWHAQFGYFLTGESVERRTQVTPLRPFDLRRGRRGPGAWEAQARFSTLHLGDQVFTRGLADPNLWANDASIIDVGLNWYLNQYVKIYFDWQHAVFGSPARFAPGPRLQKTSDLFWLRFQLYY